MQLADQPAQYVDLTSNSELLGLHGADQLVKPNLATKAGLLGLQLVNQPAGQLILN
jgi:hypothetical protein